MKLEKYVELKPHSWLYQCEDFENHIRANIGFENRFFLGLFTDHKKRSIPQLRYYFGVIVKTLANKTGHSTDEIHNYLRKKFLPIEKRIVFGEPVLKLTSTSNLSTMEFKEYNDKVRKWAYESLGEDIKSPDGLSVKEEMFLEFENRSR